MFIEQPDLEVALVAVESPFGFAFGVQAKRAGATFLGAHANAESGEGVPACSVGTLVAVHFLSVFEGGVVIAERADRVGLASASRVRDEDELKAVEGTCKFFIEANGAAGR